MEILLQKVTEVKDDGDVASTDKTEDKTVREVDFHSEDEKVVKV